MRVSVREPSIGSRTVRRRTPFVRPMFTKRVGVVLEMLGSSISAMQIEDGGAVSACGEWVHEIASRTTFFVETALTPPED